MKLRSLTALATLLVGSHAASPEVMAALASRPQPGVEILPPKQDPWYSAPPNFELAEPGQILRVRPARGNFTTVQSNSSEAYNILYRTTDSQYRPTWAVTTLLIPNNTVFNSNDKLLSYQIPYDSADLDASPSYALYSAPLADITAALGRGWFVNVPDYEGPLASFTAGVMSGHATIDSVRAVLSSGFGLAPNGTRYAMWGYSGGALASEWAAELQGHYASELEFAGVAVGGLTPNITSVLDSVSGTFTAGLVPAGILGLASQWPELEEFILENLNEEGMYNATGFLAARNYTLVEGILAFSQRDIDDYFVNGTDLLGSPIGLKVINRDGIMGYHGVPRMPLFAYKAIMDEVSPINDTDKLVSSYCGIGATIDYQRNEVGGHSDESGNGNARAVEFLEQVLSGTYNATGCQISNVKVNATASA